MGPRLAARAIGFATALFWAVHPLQTESVTFIIQLTEALAGLIYLLTLYGIMRGCEPGAAARRWLAVSSAASYMGVATKEILVSAPLVLLLYDRDLPRGHLPGSVAAAGLVPRLVAAFLGAARPAHAADPGPRGTVMIGEGVSAWMSLVTQGKAITGYLQLALWPSPLIVDYGDYVYEIVPSLSQAWPEFLFITGLFIATVIALAKWPRCAVDRGRPRGRVGDRDRRPQP